MNYSKTRIRDENRSPVPESRSNEGQRLDYLLVMLEQTIKEGSLVMLEEILRDPDLYDFSSERCYVKIGSMANFHAIMYG